MIERIGHSGSCMGLPPVEHGRTDDFCQLLHEQSGDDGNLPVWDGDLYLELHRGTYTSQSWLKMANREAEDDLRTIEAMGAGVDGGVDLEGLRASLDETWKLVLLNQFHDILPGSSINKVYEDARSQYDRIEATCAAQFDHVATESDRLRRREGSIEEVAPLEIAPTDWPMYRANVQRTSSTTATLARPNAPS